MCQPTRAYPMTNSHLLLYDFDYCEPASLDEACALLAEYGGRAQLLAGGTYLLVRMKQELESPRAVINIGRLPELRGASRTDGPLYIGALNTIREVHNLGPVQREYQALAEACAAFGSMQIQMTGTVGGNVCNGSPASDAVPALMALDAQLLLAGPEGQRTVPISQFLLGPGQTALGPEEVLTQLLLPKPAPGTGSAFAKITRVAADLAKASGAVVLVRQGDRIIDCKLAFGSVAPTVFRATETEAFLRGQVFSEDLALAAGEIVMDEVSPIDDVRSTAWYRRQVCKAVTHDLLLSAWQRAGEPDGAPAEPPADSTRRPAPRRHQLHVEAGQRAPVELTVNGEIRRLWVASNELLLNVLRERLELTGAKYGCGIGECGACTVLLNGRPALACLTLALAAGGAEVQTAEGLEGSGGVLHPLQEAFLDQGAFQCGYCTPGILMMTKALLDDIPGPDENDVREYLRGNRCRCTGYASIVRAVLDGAPSAASKASTAESAGGN